MKKSFRKSDGLKSLNLLESEKYSDDIPIRETKVVRKFGIVTNDGIKHTYGWVVSDRKDRRHGAIGPRPTVDPYCLSLYKEMFRNWK